MTPPLPSLREVPLSSDLTRISYAIRLGAAWAALVGVACSERSARDEIDSTARGEPTVTATAESNTTADETTDGDTAAAANETTDGDTAAAANETTDGDTTATDGSTTNTAAGALTTSESTAAMTTTGSPSVASPNATEVANHLDASAPVVADASLGTDASSALPPLPDTAECRGAQDEYGRCCVETYCIARIEDGTCKPASEAYGPYGSGSCECGTSEERMGPFADPSGGDQCCYTTWVITCEGRPLRIDDRAAVALLVARADWC